eukprot:CAMPEP_0119272170 /NCGR_PEP_ID=MMETSP1329-20130426/8455_1 /TAXON_ID=114041 /ORGANISM="Genus nov. species nov., Strain RCC1024" /LENGTH=371 /DNA_ID=CAMNT_0007272223 /DNA_START=134 /DNA_END=1246 /DNA_ORIENTATION=-
MKARALIILLSHAAAVVAFAPVRSKIFQMRRADDALARRASADSESIGFIPPTDAAGLLDAVAADIVDLEAPVTSLRALYPAAAAATTAAWTACALQALGSHPRLALPALHARLTIAQALAPLPLVWYVCGALRSAAGVGWKRLSSATYRRLNLGLAGFELWLGAACWWAPALTGATPVAYASWLRAAATAAHCGAAFVGITAWAASATLAAKATGGPFSHKSVLDRQMEVALSPVAAFKRVAQGVAGSLLTLLPAGGAALSDPDSDVAKDGRLAAGVLSGALVSWALVAAVAPFPLATLPLALGRRLSRAAGAFSLLAAVCAFAVKDARERGRADASTFVTLKNGLRCVGLTTLLVKAAQAAVDDAALYP